MKSILIFTFTIMFTGLLTAATQGPKGSKQQSQKSTIQHRSSQSAHFKNFWNSLSKVEKSDLKKLSNKDQSQFRKKINLKIKKYKRSLNKSNNKAHELAEQYKNCTDGEQKVNVEKALHAQVKKDFYTNLEKRKNQLSSLKKRLNKLNQSYTKREKNAKLIIARQIKKLKKSKRSSSK